MGDTQDGAAGGDEKPQRPCQTPGCENSAKMQCPTCLKLDLAQSWFCSQSCFKSYWPEHKKLHQAKQLINQAKSNPANGQPHNPWPHYNFTGTLRPGPQSARRTVPTSVDRPDYVYHPDGVSLGELDARRQNKVKVLDDAEIESMRVVGRLARECLDEAAKAVDVGVTTDELDRLVHEAAVERDCYPSPLGYHGFPKSCCTSVNEVVCHGIPDLRPLQNGDICNVDVTVFHRGFHGDLNETFLVGDQVDEGSLHLIKTTHECISQAIDIVKPGVKFREIGAVIQKHAQSNGCQVVKTYCGHGIHTLFHTSPNVPHYAMPWSDLLGLHVMGWLGLENRAIGVMAEGNTFTIEPMINAGGWQDTKWPDDWTAVTSDGKRSAQFEQTLLVTENGVEILTGRREHGGRPWYLDHLEKWNYSWRPEKDTRVKK